jgi:aspartate/methionine/tyrosine aminotransferase
MQVVKEGLAAMGVAPHEYAPPMGAFYVYVDLTAHGVTDSLGMCGALLDEAGVAVTPGVDFEEPGKGAGERRVRIGFPGSTEHVREAMSRLRAWWESDSAKMWRGEAASGSPNKRRKAT